MELFLNRISDGLSNGATYALIAMALVMIFKATTLINFAQGEFAMFGGFIALVLATEQGHPDVGGRLRVDGDHCRLCSWHRADADQAL